jgi:hypothetical protein
MAQSRPQVSVLLTLLITVFVVWVVGFRLVTDRLPQARRRNETRYFDR